MIEVWKDSVCVEIGFEFSVDCLAERRRIANHRLKEGPYGTNLLSHLDLKSTYHSGV
ncbi:43242_t:CDS:2 [Gigaspora margarita]|uniref:43242_t:CDS:1 n=1 Tax=Gigaspora margarita TaxID=4874 RepID=A0ABM8W1B1_GIGMA|nr:43242_t:CDS:2 [Gigaspora margarita]